MPITTLYFSIDPQSTGAAVGDTAYYIDDSNLPTSGGFDTNSSADNIVNMGTITGFGFQNSAAVPATKATYTMYFTSETYEDPGPIGVMFIANSNVPYSNSSDFPGAVTTVFGLFYSGDSTYTQNQVINPGIITSSTSTDAKLTGVATSSTAAGRAADFKSAIEFSTGGAMTCALATTSVANDTLVITQNVAGESGNTAVAGFVNSMDAITSSFLNSFTGGADATTSFDAYTMTIETNNLYDLPTTNDYIFFSKDNSVNLSSLIGYYAEPKFINNSTEYAEIFSVGLGITESSK